MPDVQGTITKVHLDIANDEVDVVLSAKQTVTVSVDFLQALVLAQTKGMTCRFDYSKEDGRKRATTLAFITPDLYS